MANLEGIEPYGPEDRRGPGLESLPQHEPILVDIIIWAASDRAEAQSRAAVVDEVLSRSGSSVELRSLDVRRNLIRARVSPAGLLDLLETSMVELVRTPPVPFLDFRDWRALSADDLTGHQIPSAVVGVLDDAPASGHPLLHGLIKSIDLMGPAGYPWQAPGHHGTEVVGRLLLPHLHEELRGGQGISAHGTVRVARILEPDPSRPDNPPRFITTDFPHDLVAQGIRHLHSTYGIRVFNLSVGYAEPYSDAHLGPLTEVLDELVRELNIVVVVPTGNSAPHQLNATTASGHHVAEDYPSYLDAPEHRLAEPAPAALAVTVGSLALSGAAAELPHRLGWQAVADVDQVSPFSRTGPGTGTSRKRHNKPEVVHYGGNIVVNDLSQVVPNDLGASMISTALDVTAGKLFAACNGTSYAAPAVARVAADIAHTYQRLLPI